MPHSLYKLDSSFCLNYHNKYCSKNQHQGVNIMRRTLEGTKRKRQKVSGFRARMATPEGQKTINRRRAKGRHKVAIVAKNRA